MFNGHGKSWTALNGKALVNFYKLKSECVTSLVKNFSQSPPPPPRPTRTENKISIITWVLRLDFNRHYFWGMGSGHECGIHLPIKLANGGAWGF